MLAVHGCGLKEEEDGGQGSQDTQAGTLGEGRDTPGDTCAGLLQGHTGWLPEWHPPTHILVGGKMGK